MFSIREMERMHLMKVQLPGLGNWTSMRLFLYGCIKYLVGSVPDHLVFENMYFNQNKFKN